MACPTFGCIVADIVVVAVAAVAVALHFFHNLCDNRLCCQVLLFAVCWVFGFCVGVNVVGVEIEGVAVVVGAHNTPTFGPFLLRGAPFSKTLSPTSFPSTEHVGHGYPLHCADGLGTVVSLKATVCPDQCGNSAIQLSLLLKSSFERRRV